MTDGTAKIHKTEEKSLVEVRRQRDQMLDSFRFGPFLCLSDNNVRRIHG